MKFEGLIPLLRDEPTYREFLAVTQGSLAQDGRRGGFPLTSLQVIEAARPYLIAALQRDWPGPIVVITGRPEQAHHLADEVRIWSDAPGRVLHFPAPDALFYDRSPWDAETLHARINALFALLTLQGEAQKGQGMVIT
ncbi:MAG: hypothetical protein H5T70_07600, partial [Chloroflexi bacterium]|nr:hypothetical protein [Chloroflexota bacterium]